MKLLEKLLQKDIMHLNFEAAVNHRGFDMSDLYIADHRQNSSTRW